MARGLSGVHPEIRDNIKYGLIAFPCQITASAASGIAYTLPYKMNIVDVIVRSTATVTNATARVSDGTNNITNAIIAATVDANTRATTIDTSYSTVQSIKITTASAADRAIVYIVGYPEI